jgi:uncharacterized protein YgiM (DUF1202 family)
LVLFIILGAVVLTAIVVIGILYFMLSKEGQKKEEEKAVPFTDFLEKPIVSEEPVSPATPSHLPVQSIEIKSPVVDDTYKKRAQGLEDELRTIKQKAEEQADVSREMVVTLTKENQTLKNKEAESDEALQKLTALQQEVTSLKTENANLKTQLESTNAAMSELKRVGVVEDLHPELEKINEELKYELVKAKAQNSGLERISFNYKNQLEESLKKVNAAQVTNDHLTQVKNQLEAMVEQIKLQNEELVKKDQLSQFELEKNRSRLLVLERDYEDLKARTQQKDSQV